MVTVIPAWSDYKQSTIVVWGTGRLGATMVSAMQEFGLNVRACCDSDSSKWGTTFHGVPVISPDELVKYQEKTNDLVVQLALMAIYEWDVLQKMDALSISNVVSYGDGMILLLQPFRDKLQALYPRFAEELQCMYQESKNSLTRRLLVTSFDLNQPQILLMMPRKTGDHTLMETCRKHQIPFLFGRHTPAILRRDHGKLKLISAIRDPIARDISDIFENLSGSPLTFLSNASKEDVESFIHEKNVQPFFDRHLKKKYSLSGATPRTPYTVFFDSFGRSVTDVTQAPFDTTKGYTILTTEKADIFLYQLEKLNDIVAPLSDWMGTPFTALENANVASDKWIASHYALAKKELVFSKEYVDAAYSDPYVTHFYSEEQIKTMKSKWLGHIKTPSE